MIFEPTVRAISPTIVSTKRRASCDQLFAALLLLLLLLLPFASRKRN